MPVVPIKIISRKSQLAKVQVKEIINMFPSVNFDIQYADTFGDNHKKISLLTNKKSDIFTDTIDRKILEEKADFAVHSAKDLPFPLNKKLQVVALTKAYNKSDALISKNNIKLNQLQSKARVGTSSVSRKAQLLTLRPDIIPVSIRGNIEERIELVDNGEIDAAIIATCALTRLGLQNRMSEILPFKTHPLQGNLAVTAKHGRTDLIKMFYKHDIRNNFGKVWLVGAGIGFNDSLTVKAHKILEIADIIFYDDLLDINILNKFSCEKIYVGKRKNHHSFSQEKINELLYQNALTRKNVVRLKGGDPLIFARGGEEAVYLQQRMIPLEIISGISAFNTCAASYNLPLTQRNISSTLELRTGHTSAQKNKKGRTIIYYMGASKLSEISKELLKEKIPSKTPVAIINNSGSIFENSIFTTVSKMSEEKIDSPTIIIIGECVKQLNPPEKILYTGLSPNYLNFNEKIIHYPLIKVSENTCSEINLEEYDAIIFTSKSAARFFFSQLAKNVDCNQHILSIGKQTAKEINKFGYKVDYIARKADSDSFAELVKQKKYKKILYPCSNLSGNALHKLKNVKQIVIYKTESIKQPEIDLREFKGVVFSSPSTVKSFLEIYKKIPKNLICYVFGKHTQKKLEKLTADIINLHEI